MRCFQHSRVLPRACAAGLVSVLLWLAAPGCSNNSAPPEPLAIEQLPSVMETAFKKASSEVRGMAAEVTAAVRTNGYSTAYTGLQSLSAATGLTQDQSRVVGRAMITVGALLQTAAAKGDEQATEAVQLYRSQK